MTESKASVERTEWTPARRIRVSAGYYLALVCLGLSMAAIGPTLPALAEHTGSALGEISFVFFANFSGYTIGILAGGHLYDRMNGHRLLAISLALMAAMLAVIPVSTALAVVSVAVFLAGIGEGVVDVGANTLLIWTHRNAVGPFMNALHFFAGVGMLLSPVVITWVATSTGQPLAGYWVLAILLVPAILYILRQPTPPPAISADEAPKESPPLAVTVLLSLFFFTFVGAELGFGGWIYTYALETQLADVVTAAYVNAAFLGAFTAARLIAIPASARFSPRTILATSIAGTIASVVLIAAIATSTLVLWIGAIGAGLSIGPMFATGMNFAEQRMTITGRLTSIFLVGGGVGSMVVPWIIGPLFERIGPAAMMLAVGVDMVVSLGVFLALMRAARPVKSAMSP